MTKHTKGPWTVSYDEEHDRICIDGEPAHPVCVIDPYELPENDANARLIAAAPTMLSLLENLLDANIGVEFKALIRPVVNRAKGVPNE